MTVEQLVTILLERGPWGVVALFVAAWWRGDVLHRREHTAIAAIWQERWEQERAEKDAWRAIALSYGGLTDSMVTTLRTRAEAERGGA